MTLLNRALIRISLAAGALALFACDPEEVPTPPPTGGPPVTSGSKPPCLRSPSQVVALGDSYVSLPVVLVPRIEALAQASGALSPGQSYRDYSAPGTTLGSPELPGSIPPQWDQALSEDPNVTAVIMDGGGNDLIASLESITAGCLDPGSRQNATCVDIVQGAVGVVRQMAQDMKSRGVHDVIYFLYPHVPIGGDEILDYAVEQAQQLATEISTISFRVHLVDTRQIFAGHDEYFDLDPVHTNDLGGDKIADLIWQTMKSQCIAQPSSSGCCVP